MSCDTAGIPDLQASVDKMDCSTDTTHAHAHTHIKERCVWVCVCVCARACARILTHSGVGDVGIIVHRDVIRRSAVSDLVK